MKYLLVLLLLIFIVSTIACERSMTAPEETRTVEKAGPDPMGGDPDAIGLEVHWVTTLAGVYLPPDADIDDGTLVKAYKERPEAPFAGRPMYVTWGQIKAHYRV